MRSIHRRRLLRLGLAVPVALVAIGCTDEETPPASSANPTPACADDDDETPAQTEGPYFTPGSPERADLREAGIAGTALVLTGRVLDTACRPVARALLDFWQADAEGRYDNEGFRLRGHQFTGDDGGFRLSTVVPGAYAGRTRHLHVRVQRPNGSVLTTQLYFPNEPGNANDRIFNESLLISGYPGSPTFTFVLGS